MLFSIISVNMPSPKLKKKFLASSPSPLHRNCYGFVLFYRGPKYIKNKGKEHTHTFTAVMLVNLGKYQSLAGMALIFHV